MQFQHAAIAYSTDVSLLLGTDVSAQKLTRQWTALLSQDGKYFDTLKTACSK